MQDDEGVNKQREKAGTNTKDFLLIYIPHE